MTGRGRRSWSQHTALTATHAPLKALCWQIRAVRKAINQHWPHAQLTSSCAGMVRSICALEHSRLLSVTLRSCVHGCTYGNSALAA